MYQDNLSAMNMEKNERHYYIRHFFVMDRVDKRGVKIEYCPTQMILENYFIEPRKRKLFKIFSNAIMRYKTILSLE